MTLDSEDNPVQMLLIRVWPVKLHNKLIFNYENEGSVSGDTHFCSLWYNIITFYTADLDNMPVSLASLTGFSVLTDIPKG